MQQSKIRRFQPVRHITHLDPAQTAFLGEEPAEPIYSNHATSPAAAQTYKLQEQVNKQRKLYSEVTPPYMQPLVADSSLTKTAKLQAQVDRIKQNRTPRV